MLDFPKWMASTSKPMYFDNNLKLTNNKNDATQLLQMTTWSKYIGKVIAEIRRKFPFHPDFKDLKISDVPSRWTSLHQAFDKELCSFHLWLGSDYIFGESNTRPLYCKIGAISGFSDNSQTVTDFVSYIDFRAIGLKLMQDFSLRSFKNGPLQQWCWLVTTFQGPRSRRWGQVSGLYTEWAWHPHFEIRVIAWTLMMLLENMPCLWCLMNVTLSRIYCDALAHSGVCRQGCVKTNLNQPQHYQFFWTCTT